GNTELFPATAGPHKLDDVGDRLLKLDGSGGSGSAGGLGAPVMLPGETNVLPSVGDVLSYSGTGAGGATDTMTIDGPNPAAAGFTNVSDLVGGTLEISAGPGVGRFWLITAVAAGQAANAYVLTLKNPSLPAAEWGLPDATSKFAVTHLSSNFFVTESEQVDFATVYNDAATADQTGALTATDLTGLGMAAGIHYGNLEALDVFLGSGADTFAVRGAMKRPDGFRIVTMLNTGAGDDAVTVALGAADGFFALNTEAGDDRVLAGASTAPLVLFGGTGNDSIQGGQGDDIIFGDKGR